MSEHVLQTDVAPSSMEQAYPFEFSGKAGEYFKIWIVNIALTVLTLGIFSAWAKVRTLRYFYGNTQLDGSSFDYLASPIAILKGRLIALVFFSLYWVAANFIPMLLLPIMVVFIIAFPWVVARSMQFRARNTTYRNLRFDFGGRYGEVAKVFILWPILVPFTIGLLWPYVHYRQKRLLVANSEFGDSGFDFGAEPKDFYQIYAIAFVMLLVIPMAIGLFGGIMSGVSTVFNQGGEAQAQSVQLAMVMMGLTMFVMMGAQYLVYVFVTTRITNLTYSRSELGAVRLESTLSVPRMMWIYFSNTLAIIVSVGLLVPWAKVRLARYRAENTRLYSQGGLGGFRAGASEQSSALGEEAGDMFDVDISI